MNKLLIAAMMMAALTACSQEAKQETKEAAQAIVSDVKNNTAFSSGGAPPLPPAAVRDTAEKAASEVKEAVAPEAKPAEKTEAPAAKVDGKAVYEATCKACHSGTIPGTPGVGKKDEWEPRIKQGQETLHKHAIEGFKGMPAKGGNEGLSDDEVKAAVDFMANESGAKF